MTLNQWVGFALIIGSLAGCADMLPTGVPSPQQLKPAPTSRLFAYQAKPEQAHATLIVTRDVGMLGGACLMAFSLKQSAGDGDLQPHRIVAKLATGETATFHLPPGEWQLRAGRDAQGGMLCSGSADVAGQAETVLRPGQEKRFRLGIAGDFSMRVQPDN